MENSFKALIIGCGMIGSDLDNPNSESVLTFAHGFMKHSRISKIGFVDVVFSKAKSSAKKWNGFAYETSTSAFLEDRWDVVVIAVPDAFHKSVIEDLPRERIQLLVIEKPVALEYDDLQAIESWGDERKKLGLLGQILVNYTRRFVPAFSRMRDDIQAGIFGHLIKGQGFYGKGLIHNGSHMLDLIEYWFGEVLSISARSVLSDYCCHDPSISLEIQLEGQGLIHLNAIDHQLYTLFELDLVFEKGRIRMVESGLTIEVYRPQPHNVYKGYWFLNVSEIIATDYQSAFAHLTNYMIELLSTPSDCDINFKSSLKLCRSCLALKEEALKL